MPIDIVDVQEYASDFWRRDPYGVRDIGNRHFGEILRELDLPENPVILVPGAARGVDLLAIADHIPSASFVTLDPIIELDERVVAEMSDRLIETSEDLLHVYLAKTNYRFDLIYIDAVPSHGINTLPDSQNLANVLNDGGYVVGIGGDTKIYPQVMKANFNETYPRPMVAPDGPLFNIWRKK